MELLQAGFVIEQGKPMCSVNQGLATGESLGSMETNQWQHINSKQSNSKWSLVTNSRSFHSTTDLSNGGNSPKFYSVI
ncbi:uncharacterized protein PGTG_20989 [Puccinia graminis f. sp. tritici CRL 75-36-700-3]|uniref:Uncharacterized protein n=1 Tax=Puccinia graminis f. sp. tritici (strain CRL 75-36-700-3 / race SCCL) TaxID=418459 RepID=H6QQ26_PUCGT|nr:uncharacterized protein PGTG_20989 [Puccinia graminis f. sp. tritici CRL 75-36-700-3]EHS64638.1 hypothetical protein PGTG_20989 [Puccinia graminis f. sp. tritici CRL 75-36-700-3]